MKSELPVLLEARKTFEEFNQHIDRVGTSLRAELHIVKELLAQLDAKIEALPRQDALC